MIQTKRKKLNVITHIWGLHKNMRSIGVKEIEIYIPF